MGNFSLILCCEENVELRSNGSFCKAFLSVIKKAFRNKKLECRLDVADLYEDTKAVLITLPYRPEALAGLSSFKASKILKQINNIKKRYNVASVIVPDKLSKVKWLEDCGCSAFDGKRLYKALVVGILDGISSKRNIKTGDLNIAVICGGSVEEPVSMAKLLSPHVKYLAVVTDGKEEIEEELDGIFRETGLSISVTKDYRSGLKDADVVINFGESREFVFNSKINTKAVIVNYGKLDLGRIFCENIIINGIEVRIPDDVSFALPKNIREYFTSAQLAEILIGHRLQEKLVDCRRPERVMEDMARQFAKDGYEIIGLIGRRNILKAEDIKIYKDINNDNRDVWRKVRKF